MLSLKSIIIGFIGLILASVLSFGLAAQPPVKNQKEGSASVSGRVTLKGEPARNVVVALQPLSQFGVSAPNPRLRAKSDAAGNFNLTGIPAGRYQITVQAPGYTGGGDYSRGMPGQTLNLSDGDQVDKIEFALKPGSVITGRVTGADGRPLVDEMVTLFTIGAEGRAQRYNLGQTTYYMFRTDDRGVYRLFGLSPGRYLISVGYSNSPETPMIVSSRKYSPQTFHPDATEESKAKVIELGESEEATNVDITVSEAKEAYQVRGRVVDAETGAPIIGVGVSYGRLDPSGRGLYGMVSMGVRTDAQGAFQLPNIPPGKYGVVAQFEGNSDFYSDVTPFEVVESEIVGIEVRARMGGSISGVVVIEGTSDPAVSAKLSQLALNAYPRSSGGFAPRNGSTMVNANGSFKINGLSAGKFGISLWSFNGDRRFILLRIEGGGVHQPQEIEIGEKEQLKNVKLVIGYGVAIIRGQMNVIGGQVPPGAVFDVWASRIGGEAGGRPTSQVDARGRFMIEGLMAGEYELRLGLRYSPVSSPELIKLGRLAGMIKQRVAVSGQGETPVTLALDLTPEEKER